MAITVAEIHTYPVKGLGGCPLPAATVGERGLPFDRRFGFAFADSRALLAGAAAWRPWQCFVSLKKYEQAAAVSATAAENGAAVLLTLRAKNGECAAGNPDDKNERRQLEDFLSDTLRCPRLRLIDSQHQPLWDEKAVPMSLINQASVLALAADTDMPAQAARFRANLLLTGADAWQEERWAGTIGIGEVRLALAGGIPRCAATTVNPDSAQRDCRVPELLTKQRRHNEFGLFATVARAGELVAGREGRLEPSA